MTWQVEAARKRSVSKCEFEGMPRWAYSRLFLGGDVADSTLRDPRAARPAGAAWAALRLLPPSPLRFSFFVLVLHRALPDLQRMKLCYSAAASSAPRSVFPWCD